VNGLSSVSEEGEEKEGAGKRRLLTFGRHERTTFHGNTPANEGGMYRLRGHIGPELNDAGFEMKRGGEEKEGAARQNSCAAYRRLWEGEKDPGCSRLKEGNSEG